MSLPAIPPAPSTPPAAPRPPDLDDRIRRILDGRARALPVSPGAGRAAIRRRLARLHRRRRVRHALGSGTLAAGLVAGGVQARPGGDPGPVAPAASAAPGENAGQRAGAPQGPAATPSPTTGPPPAAGEPSPAAPAQAEGRSWTWDAGEGVDRAAADPGAVHAGGRFHVYTTSAAHCVAGDCRPYRVPRFTSPDLASPGRLAGDAMPARPAWVDPGDDAIWAPAVAPTGAGYTMYFAASARHRDGGMKCLGAAVAATPDGPFAPLPEPLLCTPGYWNIDPYAVHGGGRWHLLWRQDDAANATGRIVSAPLAPGGLALAGDRPPVTLLTGQTPWEEGHPGTPGIGPVENPAMVRHLATGEWVLTWSANRWETPAYATGLATCAGPAGPCRRTAGAAPWLRTGGDAGLATPAAFGGAGGLSFVTRPGDGTYAVFHAYAGAGRAPSPRVGWAYRVEADPAARGGYRLVEIAGNLSAPPPVGEA
ncbi:MAG TPA: family 43 glycosylhydrolase [Acidimicrobiales bacterium]